MNPYTIVPEDVSGPKPRSRGDEPIPNGELGRLVAKTPLTRG